MRWVLSILFLVLAGCAAPPPAPPPIIVTNTVVVTNYIYQPAPPPLPPQLESSNLNLETAILAWVEIARIGSSTVLSNTITGKLETNYDYISHWRVMHVPNPHAAMADVTEAPSPLGPFTTLNPADAYIQGATFVWPGFDLVYCITNAQQRFFRIQWSHTKYGG